MTVLSPVIVLVAGYLALAVAFRGQDGTIVFDVISLAVAVLLVVVAAVAHEGVHGLAILAYGGRPTFGAGMASKVLPYLYCTAAGQQFSVGRYVVVALAPTVINGALIAGLLSPNAGWFVLPFAVHIGGCIGDWFLTVRALRAPRGSLVLPRTRSVRGSPSRLVTSTSRFVRNPRGVCGRRALPGGMGS